LTIVFSLLLLLLQVKVILRVTKDGAAGDGQSAAAGAAEPSAGGNFMSVDKKHRQLTLIDPNAPPASDGNRRVGVAAPKMFAFDALFTPEDSQVIEIFKSFFIVFPPTVCVLDVVATVCE